MANLCVAACFPEKDSPFRCPGKGGGYGEPLYVFNEVFA